jgi:AmmeMemoRadiSam system protein A
MAGDRTNVGVDLGLSDEDKSELRDIARKVIEARAKGAKLPDVQPTTEKLKEKRGAFVCIHKQGMLRGCIGSLQPDSPLYEQVKEMALAAAFRDPRFTPLKAEELPFLEVEISVLTPFSEIHGPDEIEIGKHGLMVTNRHRSGLLLPQVASDRNWGPVTFLEETCGKAGLPKDAWKHEDTVIHVFSADVF